ncbi:MAG: Zn-ribbon domain-containing OB-fold protein [Acidimicrobiales bacterium]
MGEHVPVRDGLFTDEPRLLGSHCRACGGHHFPRHVVCPYCSSDEVDAVELSPVGRLWAWTAVTAPPPGYRGEVPFGFGVVELPEGIRVVTRLTESDPGRLVAGDAMELVLVPLHVDDDGRQVVSYAFAPSTPGARP